MSKNADGADHSSVLQSKRNATRYQILVQIAERQPTVSQQEIADAIGVTAQAVSDYLQGLVEQGYATKHGRGRYEVTKEGVDWLMSQTDELHEFVQHVSEDVIGQVEIETAIATTAISEGETVSLTMQDGALRALSGDVRNATAIAVTDANPDQDVGITNFEGIVDHDVGVVTIVSIPRVEDGGSAMVDPPMIADYTDTHELVATAGTEALAASRAASLEPDIRFGTVAAVQEAATKGLDILLLATTNVLSAHTDELREGNISYEVIDAAEE
jgi:putative transcriptional regulator